MFSFLMYQGDLGCYSPQGIQMISLFIVNQLADYQVTMTTSLSYQSRTSDQNKTKCGTINLLKSM